MSLETPFSSPNEKQNKKTRLLVKKGNVFVPLQMKKIAAFYYSAGVTFAIEFNGKKSILEESLVQLEPIIDADIFFKVSRKIILNVEAIKQYKCIEFGKVIIDLVSPDWIKEQIIVSQVTAPLFKAWINSI
jgi:two-component system, LytTR family, response regulator LytT